MSITTAIPDEMMPALEGIVPATLTTCSKEGMANVTYISQVFYVDEQHVALSCQFMNKTWRNLQENPHAKVIITCPKTFSMWELSLRFVEEQTEGPIYDEMDMQLAAIASLHGMEGVFQIKSALICEVEAIKRLYVDESLRHG
jgi:hypothetical protein